MMSNAIIKLGTAKFNKWLNQCPVDYEFLNDEKKRAYTVGSFAIYFD